MCFDRNERYSRYINMAHLSQTFGKYSIPDLHVKTGITTSWIVPSGVALNDVTPIVINTAEAPGAFSRLKINIGNDILYVGMGKDTVNGNPSAPCLCMNRGGIFRFRWVVMSGARTISIKVKQAANVSPRPRMIVRANKEVGFYNDVAGDAPSGTDWVTIGPLELIPENDGVLLVEIQSRYAGSLNPAPCYWDKIETT